MLDDSSKDITSQLNVEEIFDASIKETSTGINQVIDSKMSSFKTDLKEEIKKILQDVKKNILEILMKENRKLRNRVTVLEDETDHIYDKMYELEKVAYNMNQYGRKNNIEIRGIPDGVTDDALETTSIHILSNLFDTHIDADTEVEACHRLKGGIEGSKDTIIKFCNRNRSDKVKNNRLKAKILDLREFGIAKKCLYINDNLCLYYKSLAYKCRALKRLNLIDSVNVQDGKIIITSWEILYN